jgi:serine protease Do
MKRQHILQAMMAIMLASSAAVASAQESPAPPPPPPPPARADRPQKSEQIIIRKKGDKEEKMTVVIDGDKITVNGKPLAEYKGDDIIVNQKRLDALVGHELELAHMDKQLAEMNDQLAGLDGQLERQIELSIQPEIENRLRSYRYHYRAPHPARPGAPQAWSWSDDAEGFGEPRAFLGVTTEKDEKGAKIVDVTSNSAASKAGLAAGDIITTVDGRKVTDHKSLSETVSAHKPGEEVEVGYISGKKAKKVKVKLGETKGFTTFNLTAPRPGMEDIRIEMPDEEELNAPMKPFPPFAGGQDMERMFRNDGPRLGVQVQDLPEGKGVKVNEVRPESPAAKAGLQKEDIITHVDSKDIKDTGDMIDAVRDAKDKASFWISVQRKGAPLNVEVKIPKPIRKAELLP